MDMQSKAKKLIEMIQTAPVEWKPLGEVADYEQPTKYLVASKNYDDKFDTPVLTAGKTFILGYTDETEGIYKASESPVIIFDDFTTANKWVDFDFKVKSSAMKIITSKNEQDVLLKYVYYWLNTLPNSLTDGDHKRQWISNFSNKEIPIPSLETQKKIVKILDKFTELEATLEAELALRKRQYRYYRDFLLDFNNQIGGGIADGYQCRLKDVVWKTLGEVGTLIRGNGLQKKDFTEDGIPAIHYGQIYTQYGNQITETISFVSPELAEKLRKVDKGDVVITNTSENIEDVGKALLYLGERQAVTGGHATIFKPGKEIIGKFFVHFTQTEIFNKAKRKFAKGTKVIDVSATDMAKIKIPIPPLPEQEKIVAILDKFDTLTHSVSEGLPHEIALRRKQYEYYREQLLAFR
ncbi:restriction endonuclease subunit S [Neisseria lactamica]|uniref:restriction endonuclease subunit S n=1 Tax=Neisseria lactamica TaxID=486 RepID=UPI000E5714BC|nr:restriction endonuclease subunit S [Neisseria lactamica]